MNTSNKFWIIVFSVDMVLSLVFQIIYDDIPRATLHMVWAAFAGSMYKLWRNNE